MNVSDCIANYLNLQLYTMAGILAVHSSHSCGIKRKSYGTFWSKVHVRAPTGTIFNS